MVPARGSHTAGKAQAHRQAPRPYPCCGHTLTPAEFCVGSAKTSYEDRAAGIKMVNGNSSLTFHSYLTPQS